MRRTWKCWRRIVSIYLCRRSTWPTYKGRLHTTHEISDSDLFSPVHWMHWREAWRKTIECRHPIHLNSLGGGSVHKQAWHAWLKLVCRQPCVPLIDPLRCHWPLPPSQTWYLSEVKHSDQSVQAQVSLSRSYETRLLRLYVIIYEVTVHS